MKCRKRRVSDAELPDHEIHIPIEFLTQILARLPVKTLLRFRCVCKLWCSVIDSQDFIDMHLKLFQNNRKRTHLLVMEEISRFTGEERIFTIRRADTLRKTAHLFNNNNSYQIIETCNGLALLWQCNSGVESDLRLWNPSIQKALLLPACPFEHKCRPLLLGFSPFPNDYKLVVFRYIDGVAQDVSIAVYSLRNHSWRVNVSRIKVPLSFMNEFPSERYRVFCGGAIYGIGRDPYLPEVKGNHKTHLVSFNFDSEDFISVEIPDAAEKVFIRYIFLLGESVAVFTEYIGNSCVWVLEKDGVFRKDPRLSRDLQWDSSSALQGLKMLYERLLYNQDSDTFILRDFDRVNSFNATTHQGQQLGKSIRGTLTLDTYVESLELHKGTQGQSLTFFP